MSEQTIDKDWLEAWQKSVEDELVKMRKRVEQATRKQEDTWRYCDRLSAVFMDLEARLNKLESSNTPADAQPEPTPCPWCGCEAKLNGHWDLDGQPYHIVKCESCEAQGPFSRHSGDLAIKRWNRVAERMPYANDG